MASLVDNIKAILTGLKVTLTNFMQEPVTTQYPWEYDDLPENSRGMLRMVDFHDEQSIEEKSSWYAGTRWAPCTSSCPAHTDARGYVSLVAEGKYPQALRLLRQTYPLVGTLGRICPAPCEKGCTRAFTNAQSCAIRNIKRSVADWELAQTPEQQFDYQAYCCQKPLNGHTVGIVGAGPAGYQCAMLLRLFGFEVTLYEAKSVPGGFLTQAIPPYRLPRDIVNNELERIHSLPGVHLQLNCEIGRDLTFAELEAKHDEVIVAAGAWKPYKLGLDNEVKPYVWYGEEFLEAQINGLLKEVPANVVVVGGGNTGFDCARTCRRLGAKVTMIYRRTRKEMPSEDEEIEDGQAEGVKLEYLTSPARLVIENGLLSGLEVIKNKLGEKDRSGRRSPVAIPGSEEILECQMVITALGRSVDLPWAPEDIKKNCNGTLIVDGTGKTSRDHVWACGDVVKVATVVAALGGADQVCLSIAKRYDVLPEQFNFLYPYGDIQAMPYADGSLPTSESGTVKRRQGMGWTKPVPAQKPDFVLPAMGRASDKPFRKSDTQAELPKIDQDQRLQSFAEVSTGYTPEVAAQESKRCFGCAAEMCVGCGVCADACPDGCIVLRSQTSPSGRTFAADYSIDFTKCCFCGLCSGACPTKSLVMTSNFEMAVYDKRDIFMTRSRLNLGLVREEKHQLGSSLTGLAPDMLSDTKSEEATN